MIKKLKKRPRSDSHDSQARIPRKRWDRAIYLTLLAAFFLMLGNYFVGDRVFLRADGLVLRDRTVLSATSLVRVSDIRIRTGQAVSQGDMLFRAESPELLDRLAEFSMRVAELDQRAAELVGRARLSAELLPLARDRAKKLKKDRARLGTALIGGSAPPARRQSLLTTSRRQTVESQAYEAEAEFKRLKALRGALENELQAVASARQQAQEAVERLEGYYADGLLFAPIDGVISGDVPSTGEVFTPGDPMTTVLWGTPYILTYLPNGYIFELKPGQTVRVRGGNITQVGRIEKILPVSDSLPDEFQNTFRSRERRQLARISLPLDSSIPTHATVQIDNDSKLRSGFASVIKVISGSNFKGVMEGVETIGVKSPRDQES